jgi:hypothetical protein
MNASGTRREFLAEVGRGTLVATVGYELASELGWLQFGREDISPFIRRLEPLVCLMQEIPSTASTNVGQGAGTELGRLVEVAALANSHF